VAHRLADIGQDTIEYSRSLYGGHSCQFHDKNSENFSLKALKSFSRSYFLNPTDDEVKNQILSTKALICQLEQVPQPQQDLEMEEIDA